MTPATLDYLADYPSGSSAVDLARDLGIKPTTARQRIYQMRRAGIIERCGERPPMGRGSREALYRLRSAE